MAPNLAHAELARGLLIDSVTMSEDKKPETPAPRGKSKLVAVLLVVNVLVLAGAGATVYFVMGHSSSSARADAPTVEDHGASTLGPLIEIEPMVVNLDEEPPRFVRIAMQLELTSEEARERVEPRMVPVRSAVLLQLSGLHAGDLGGRESRETQLEALREQVNQVVGAPLVRHIYLTELVVQ